MTTALRHPSAALAPFVKAVWYVEDDLPPARERKLPTGEMQIVVNLTEDELRWYGGTRLDQPRSTHGAGLCGVLAGPVGIDTAEQRRVLGISFRPGGTLPFFSAPARSLTEPVIGLDALWGRAGQTLRERLLEHRSPAAMLAAMESVLLDRVVGSLRPDPALLAAAAALSSGNPVGGVADALGTTRSTFTRRFRHGIGLAPKPFARIRRLQRVIGSLRRPEPAPGAAVDWAEMAARHGFFDQAHLINDFRSLTGLTPAAYEPRSGTAPNHVPLSA
ncbi:MAG: DUF6597 domain-containing transcriptional factor [Geodermatophilaceae bacterium]